MVEGERLIRRDVGQHGHAFDHFGKGARPQRSRSAMWARGSLAQAPQAGEFGFTGRRWSEGPDQHILREGDAKWRGYRRPDRVGR